MFHNILYFISLLILILASSTIGLIAPLIPPLSPDSPFYSQILEANNISTTTANITLNQSHYMLYLLSQSPNEKSAIYFKRNAGYHVMNMYIGKPIQKMYGLFDTGSSIVWFQCSERAGKSKFPFYNETRSTTYTTISCNDEQRCNTQDPGIIGCDQLKGLCEFKITYGDGDNVYGAMGSEVVMFTKPTWRAWPQFMLGCSWDNSQTMMGIIGGSHSDVSLPMQLYPEDPKFSYCISDNLSKTNVINFGPNAILKGQSLTMKSNRDTKLYYVTVLSIKVNGESIDVPSSTFDMSEDGARGVIMDSGTVLTHLTAEAFVALKAKVAYFLGPPIKYLIFEICYTTGKFGSVWPFKKRPTIGLEYYPDFAYEFEEEMVWQFVVGSPNLECLQIIRTLSSYSILGAYNFLNVNVGYDPGNGLLYLEKTTCP